MAPGVAATSLATVRTRAHWIPSARVRLCSTQTYFQENKDQPCSLVQTHLSFVELLLETSHINSLTMAQLSPMNVKNFQN